MSGHDHGHGHAPSAPKASSNSGGGNDPLAEGNFGLSFGFMAVLAGFVANILIGKF